MQSVLYPQHQPGHVPVCGGRGGGGAARESSKVDHRGRCHFFFYSSLTYVRSHQGATFEKQVIGDNDVLEGLKNNIEDIGITAQGLGSLNYPSGKLSLG